MKNFKIFVSEPKNFSIILAAWLLSCVIIFFFITLFWQLVLMFLTFLITGSYLVVTKLRYMHSKRRGRSVSNNHDAISYILTVTMGVTCASTALIAVAYVLSIPAKISDSNSVDYLPSTVPISKPVVMQQNVGEGAEALLPINLLESAPSPTAYIILSRPTSLYKPVSTSTPVPAFFSNNLRALELYPSFSRVVISQVSISSSNTELSDSYVILINNSVEISISDWTLSNGKQHTCKFQSLLLKGNSVTKVTSGIGSILESEASCTGSTEFWNSQPAILRLQDPMGNVVDQWINIRSTEIEVVEVQ